MVKKCGRWSARPTWTNCAANPTLNGKSQTIEALDMIPNYYLQYFYYTKKSLDAQKRWPPSRAEEVMEIEADLLQQYADPSERTPGRADETRRGLLLHAGDRALDSHYNDLGQVHVVNVPKRGAGRAGRKTGCSSCPAGWTARGSIPCQPSRSRRFVLAYWPK